ncbi:MAG TPA: 3-phosphoglycerate dehydrogenase [Clostridiales bacterium]|jgi:D-3-phosphoglycerate dehydrogenase|nr:3-phosphoglycerate dehydrogenase [Clostridiales bacterium]
MYTVKTLNKIAEIGTQRLGCSLFCIDDCCENPDAILVRSAKVDPCSLGDKLLCIARAGAGVNNIPLDACTEKGIVVFNSPGANSGGVKELVIASLIIASRDIIGGIEWVRGIADKGDEVPALVEKGKSAFAGPEIFGKTLGIIGLGAIGAKVAQDAYALGMKVMGYDPFLSETVRMMLAGKATFVEDVSEIYKNCHYITLHLPYTEATKNIINAETISMMMDGVRIINLARGELVNDDDMLAAIESGKVARYVTDFPNAKTANAKGVIPIPHLGASTPESEDNCAIMAADEIREYIVNGNIINSVNFPSVSMERSGECRLVILRRNIDGMQSAFLDAIKAEGLAAVGTADKSKGNTAATIIDLGGRAGESLISKISAIDGVIRVRAI